jgi:hypothetical protein
MKAARSDLGKDTKISFEIMLNGPLGNMPPLYDVALHFIERSQSIIAALK